MTRADEPMEWIEYQQNEIDGAKNNIQQRQRHVSGEVGYGILSSSIVNDHQHSQTKAYLEGYADALEFALNEVERIDNLAKYALEAEPPEENDES